MNETPTEPKQPWHNMTPAVSYASCKSLPAPPPEAAGETARTDAEIDDPYSIHLMNNRAERHDEEGRKKFGLSYIPDVVPADFARTLERELNYQLSIVKQLESSKVDQARITRELFAKQADYNSGLVEEVSALTSKLAELTKDRDEARTALEDLHAAMIRYEGDVDGDAPPRHHRLMERVRDVLNGVPVNKDLSALRSALTAKTLEAEAEAEALRKDKERLDWLAQMVADCEGRLLTRLFLPDGKPLRDKMDKLMAPIGADLSPAAEAGKL